ncbi:hypothetical protein HPB50_000628 [Hyalomma asiaticum]|uniref:Uncharacterized protein n=1 Tax=Hyalomma asiaticum TaxID=266040 RepID=A0ACB7TGG0_HYAAI|nr:hypothetical protein HPB50_000628 [Hyalomma asiaticum]
MGSSYIGARCRQGRGSRASVPARGRLRREQQGPRSSRSPIATGSSSKTEQAMNSIERPGLPQSLETATSMEPGEIVGGDVSACPVQAPASNEDPDGAHDVGAPVSMKPIEASDGPAWPPAPRFPTSTDAIEALEGHIWPSPAPLSKGPIEAIECHTWPPPVRTPASVSHAGVSEGQRPQEPGRRGQAELVLDEQEYWERQQAAGQAQEAPAMDGVFPAYRGKSISLSRACLIFVILVVVVITCYIITTRIIFLAQWSPAALLDSFYGPTRKTVTHGTPQPEVW